MSREIKFRVWDKKFGMMYGDGISVQGDGTFYLERADHDGNEIEIAESEHGELVLMQFTGLLDRQGKEIYEGDILQPHRHTKVALLRCEVYFDAGAFRLRGPQHTDRPLAVCMGDASRAGNDYVIIGNIHEHPELLNQTGH